MQRILVIRGGAIGDFILTLPTLRVLRDNFPSAHIEILGYKHIVALAENRYYANATHSIEYAPLSRFFSRDTQLPPDLVEYFGGFDLVISYLFDPDKIFAQNLRRCGVGRLIAGSPKFNTRQHATFQLAAPLSEIGLQLTNPSAKIFPNESDRTAAADFLRDLGSNLIAIHPGSGSEKKNWPIENWIALGNYLLGEKTFLVVVSGEADESRTTQLRSHWQNNPSVRFATNLPLPHLAAILQNAIFVGHDSGISHLAAAAGAKCVLLFGPTDPAIWAPRNENVKILCASGGSLTEIQVVDVRTALASFCHAERSRGISHY